MPARPARRHDPGRHPQGVHRPEGVVLPDRPGDAPAGRHDRVVLARACRAGTRSRSPATTSARPARRPRRSSRSRSRTASPTSSRRSTRGLDVDDFAPRLSFFFNAQIDFFEEIAKYRAARRIWARELRETFGAQEPALVADALPHADRRRVADRAAAAQQHRRARRSRRSPACSAARSRCTPTPTTRRSRCRPRTRCGSRCARSRSSPTRPASTNTIDPLGGCYFVEALTDELERQAYDYFAPHRRARRHGRGGQAELPAARDRRRQLRAAAARSTPAGASSSASTRFTEGDDDADADPADRPGARAQADRPPAGGARAPRRPAPSRPRSSALREAAAGEREPDAAAARLRARARDRGRDRRRRCRRSGATTPRRPSSSSTGATRRPRGAWMGCGTDATSRGQQGPCIAAPTRSPLAPHAPSLACAVAGRRTRPSPGPAAHGRGDAHGQAQGLVLLAVVDPRERQGDRALRLGRQARRTTLIAAADPRRATRARAIRHQRANPHVRRGAPTRFELHDPPPGMTLKLRVREPAAAGTRRAHAAPDGLGFRARRAACCRRDARHDHRSHPEDPRRRRQARARRARPRREDHRPRAARRRHGGHLHRPAPDARSRSSRPSSRRTPTPSACRSSRAPT